MANTSNRTPSGKIIVLSAIGAKITWHDMDVETCTLTPRQVSHAPQNVQYLWPGPAGSNLFYIASTSQGPKKEAPGGGYGFGPRHIDIDAAGRRVYASLERQNQLAVFDLRDDRLSADPVYVRTTLKNPDAKLPESTHQLTSTVHVHPAGHVVYVANRASGRAQPGGDRAVFEGGDNSIAVFALNPQTGEPVLIQNEDTHGIHPRTFAIDPTGRMMVAAHIQAVDVRDGSAIRSQPASMTTFRIGADGRLLFVNKYDVETAGQSQFWMGMIAVS